MIVYRKEGFRKESVCRIYCSGSIIVVIRRVLILSSAGCPGFSRFFQSEVSQVDVHDLTSENNKVISGHFVLPVAMHFDQIEPVYPALFIQKVVIEDAAVKHGALVGIYQDIQLNKIHLFMGKLATKEVVPFVI